MEDTCIIVCMIVKNESHIIEGCLKSALSLAQSYCIVDTGSNDTTVGIIKSVKFPIEGKIVAHKWKDFGHNRTLAFRETQDHVRKLMKSHNYTKYYALMLDADHILEYPEEFDQELTKDAYYITQINENLKYNNLRLLRLDLDFKCKGVTHEYWDLPNGNYDTLQDIIIMDTNKGNNRRDKFTRDYKLLLEGLKNDPHNIRYYFYMAQTCKDLQIYDQAIHYYTIRTEIGGWNDEIYYSLLQLGKIYDILKNYKNSAEFFLKAYRCDMSRAEPLYYLSKVYRITGKLSVSYKLLIKASEMGIPDSSSLFVETDIYNYMILVELAIIGILLKTKNKKAFIDGKRSLLNLLKIQDLPENIKKYINENKHFYKI
jgi:tetratricopeptide (TPR) repeat protein